MKTAETMLLCKEKEPSAHGGYLTLSCRRLIFSERSTLTFCRNSARSNQMYIKVAEFSNMHIASFVLMKIKIHMIDLLNESERKTTPPKSFHVFFLTQECFLVDLEESIMQFVYYLLPFFRRFVTQ